MIFDSDYVSARKPLITGTPLIDCGSDQKVLSVCLNTVSEGLLSTVLRDRVPVSRRQMLSIMRLPRTADCGLIA